MENTEAVDQRLEKGIVLREIGEKLLKLRYAFLIPAFVLMGIWFVGRGLEATTSNSVFDPVLIRWIFISVIILLVVFVILSLFQYVRSFVSSNEDRKPVIPCWVFFALLVAAVVFIYGGNRIAARGFYALASGAGETAEQALILIFKFAPANPILPLQLAASVLLPGAVDVDLLFPFAFSFPTLFAFFVWSILYGSFLLSLQGLTAPKVVHLFCALVCIFLLMVLKSVFDIEKYHLVLLHAGAAALLLFQVLLTYASLRHAAAKKMIESDFPAKAADLLPPSALGLALILIFFFPVLADIHNQFALSRTTQAMITDLAKKHTNSPSYVTAAQVSVRSGPGLGDDIVGILPKGTRISSIDEMNEWISIGKKRWISSKFLVPAGQ